MNVTSSIPTPFNNWYYVGMTYNGSTLTAYIDGVSAGSITFNRFAPYNSGNGLFAFTNSGGLRDRSAFISVVATNKPTIDSAFCGEASSENSKVLTFRALGLQVDTRKGSGRLK